MPAPEQLPDDLRDLAYRNGFELSHTRWDSDVKEMTRRLGLGKADAHESRLGAIVVPGADHPVPKESGSAVSGSTPSSMKIASGAGVALLVFVSLVAWLMSGADPTSTDQSTNLPATVGTTSVAPPPVTPKDRPVEAPSPRPELTIKSSVTKDGGAPKTQRSPQLDHQETFETTGALKMEFELSRGACSKVRFHIFIDGNLVRQTEFFDDTTGVLDLGPLSPGRHTLTLSPEGQLGGCNDGTLGSWGGALTLYVGA